MLKKIEMGLLLTYLNICGFFSGIKKDERGISGTVVAVLLILIAVIVIAFIWFMLGPMIIEWWETITSQADSVQPLV